MRMTNLIWVIRNMTSRFGICSVSAEPVFPVFAKREAELRHRKSPARSRLPATARTATPATGPSTPTSNDPNDQEKYDSTYGGVDDERDDSNTKVNAQSRQQPIAKEGSDDSHYQVSDKAEPAAIHDFPRQPTGNNTDQHNDEKTLV